MPHFMKTDGENEGVNGEKICIEAYQIKQRERERRKKKICRRYLYAPMPTWPEAKWQV